MNIFNLSEEKKHILYHILVKQAKKILKNYVLLQVDANKLLTGKDFGKKEQRKLLKIFNKMSVLEGSLIQLTKTYEILMGGNQLNVQALTKNALKKYATEDMKNFLKKHGEETNVDMPADTPKEIRDMIAAMKQKGGMDIKVVKLPKETYGVNPTDYENFTEFQSAVEVAKQKHEGKSSEEIITDSIIEKEEAKANNTTLDATKPSKKDKLN